MGLCEKWLKIGKKILKILNCFFETFLLNRPKQFRKLNIQSKSRDLTVAYNDILADVYNNLSLMKFRDKH